MKKTIYLALLSITSATGMFAQMSWRGNPGKKEVSEARIQRTPLRTTRPPSHQP